MMPAVTGMRAGSEAAAGTLSGVRGRGRGGGDYSHLPRVEMVWDFPGGWYCCPECGEPFTLLGDHWSGEQLDWQVIVRVAAHCRRRYRRACGCRVPATVMAPGPPKAIGKGLLSNAFIAILLVERFVAGRSMNSLVTGFSRQGAEVSPATLAGTCAQAGRLLVPLADAITERSRASWHLHADETTWQVFAPREGDGPAWSIFSAGPCPAALRAGRRREPRPAEVVDGHVAGTHQGPVRRPRSAHGRLAGRRARPAGQRRCRSPIRVRPGRQFPEPRQFPFPPDQAASLPVGARLPGPLAPSAQGIDVISSRPRRCEARSLRLACDVLQAQFAVGDEPA